MKKNRIRSKIARMFLFLLLCNQCYFLQLSGSAIPWAAAIEALSNVAQTAAILSGIFIGKKIADKDSSMHKEFAHDELANLIGRKRDLSICVCPPAMEAKIPEAVENRVPVIQVTTHNEAVSSPSVAANATQDSSAISDQNKQAAELVRKVATIEWQNITFDISESDKFAYQTVALKQLEKFKPEPWTFEKTNNGCRLSSPDHSLTVGVEFKTVSEVERNVARGYEEYLAQCEDTYREMQDPEKSKIILSKIENATRVIMQVGDEDLGERIDALFTIAETYLPEPYDSYFDAARWNSLTQHFNSDGSLINLGRKDLTKADAHLFIERVYGAKATKLPFMKELAASTSLSWTDWFYRKVLGSGKRCSSGYNLAKILNNPENIKLRKFLAAYKKHDLLEMKTVRDSMKGSYRGYAGEIYRHAIELIKEHMALFDNDPSWHSLTYQQKQDICENVQSLAAWQEKLLFRRYIKNSIAKAWGIENNNSSKVEKALYEIIGTDGACLTDVPRLIGKVIEVSAQDEELVKAFFMSNGTMKNFAHLDRAKQLPNVPGILTPDYADIRNLLNQLIYIESAHDNPDIIRHASEALDYYDVFGPEVSKDVLEDRLKDAIDDIVADFAGQYENGTESVNPAPIRIPDVQVIEPDVESLPPIDPDDFFGYIKKSFNKSIKELSDVYGESNVKEAVELLKLNKKRMEKLKLTPDQVIKLIEALARDLQKINSNPRFESFKCDPAKGAVTLGAVDEALAAIACEEQGLLQGPLRRATHKGDDIVDALNKVWDIKTASSFNRYGEKIFNAQEFVKSLKKGSLMGERLIIDITNLIESDLMQLYGLMGKFSAQELSQAIIVHRNNIARSCTDLIKLFCRK